MEISTIITGAVITGAISIGGWMIKNYIANTRAIAEDAKIGHTNLEKELLKNYMMKDDIKVAIENSMIQVKSDLRFIKDVLSRITHVEISEKKDE